MARGRVEPIQEIVVFGRFIGTGRYDEFCDNTQYVDDFTSFDEVAIPSTKHLAIGFDDGRISVEAKSWTGSRVRSERYPDLLEKDIVDILRDIPRNREVDI